MNRLSLYGIGCVIFGISNIIYAILDYEYRIYAYRYLSTCELSISCPYPGLVDNLVSLGIIIIIGVILLSYRKIKHRIKIRK